LRFGASTRAGARKAPSFRFDVAGAAIVGPARIK
jgi:hypothetical protein